jgi:hypothetical protein
VIIDRTHRTWAAVCLVLLVAAGAGYVVYARTSLGGPSGGSWMGLAYGFAGYGLMLFAGALGLRARRPTWRLGRAETWLRGHIWLALLAYPLILFHGGFGLGGPLTLVLMILFTVVTVSGIVGVLLQQVLPRTLMDRVPLETVYEELDHVSEQLSVEASVLVLSATDPEQVVAAVAAATPGRRGSPDARRRQLGKPMTMLLRVPPPEASQLKEFYEREVRPYLASGGGRGRLLAAPAKAAVVFGHLRTRLPPDLHPVVDDLEAICEERRQLRLQRRLHHWLHGWLLVHVPLSVTLLVLSLVHAVIALRY